MSHIKKGIKILVFMWSHIRVLYKNIYLQFIFQLSYCLENFTQKCSWVVINISGYDNIVMLNELNATTKGIMLHPL